VVYTILVNFKHFENADTFKKYRIW